MYFWSTSSEGFSSLNFFSSSIASLAASPWVDLTSAFALSYSECQPSSSDNAECSSLMTWSPPWPSLLSWSNGMLSIDTCLFNYSKLLIIYYSWLVTAFYFSDCSWLDNLVCITSTHSSPVNGVRSVFFNSLSSAFFGSSASSSHSMQSESQLDSNNCWIAVTLAAALSLSSAFSPWA